MKLRFLLLAVVSCLVTSGAMARTVAVFPPSINGFGTFTPTTNTSQELSSLGLGAGSPIWPNSTIGLTVSVFNNVSVGGGTVYVCPLGGTCSATVGIPVAQGYGYRFYQPSTLMTIYAPTTPATTVTVQWAGPASRERTATFAGGYSGVVGAATSLTLSNPEDDASANPLIFQAAADIVIDEIGHQQYNVPATLSDVTQASSGDQCLYARTNPNSGPNTVEPGPAEIHCFPTYTLLPYPEGLSRRIVWNSPSGAGVGVGLFFPKNSTFTCPSQMAKQAGGSYSGGQIAAASFACTIQYHIASASETVGRILRIPYLDTSVLPPALSGNNVIDPTVPWYQAWSDTSNPFTILGFSLYLGVTGLNAVPHNTRAYQSICLLKKSGGTTTGSACLPDLTYTSAKNVPDDSYYPGFYILPSPLVLNPGEQLFASCISANGTVVDCAMYALYPVVPTDRIASINDYYWDVLGFVPLSNMTTGAYCSTASQALWTTAGKNVMTTIVGTSVAPWASFACADRTCACENYWQTFPGH